ncbi:MAG: L-histidine N(alpha)-methyltransferase [Planctomycetes bacterium]|nr:L-histidine N(alpha)-methyltransferase [Planctomycetota bacterium]
MAASIVLHDFEPSIGAFLDEVLEGLSQPQKRLPSKYFYDRRGCELFEQICELEEYYLTRTELTIMRCWAGEMAARIGPRAMLLELGSGASLKTRLLLDRLQDPAAYVPVDIAREHLMATAAKLRLRYPGLDIRPLCADFFDWFEPPEFEQIPERTVVYFPGSTIGNFDPEETETLLERMAALAGSDGGLLIGFDLQKDPAVIEAAYNDARGVTAAFNKNLLARINRELDANFHLEHFDHRALYNADAGRIEMHLVSRRPQTVRVHGRAISFARGESICTEYSYKYNHRDFRRDAAGAGYRHVQTWTDERDYFAVAYFEVA